MDEKELAKKVLEEIGDTLKEDAKDLKGILKEWGEILIKLKIERLKGGSTELLAELKKSEEYSWAGIEAVKAEYSKIFVGKTWELVGKILKVVRIAFI